jgi:RHS repeat-associated protein
MDDNIYRMTNQTIAADPASVNGSLTYALDPVGNRLSLTSSVTPIPSQSFTYDADDRISGDTFDGNGTTLSSNGIAYTFDFEDRLLTATPPSFAAVSMTYDGDGNRVAKTVSGVTTKYLVDTQTPTGYAQVAEEIVNGSVNAQYLYGLMHISLNRAGALSYYGFDGHGSVRQLTSAAGAVTDTYSYDAFGGLLTRTGNTQNSYMFAGEQYDIDLNLYYLRARWYNQRTGRFITADTFEGLAVRPATLNGYQYTNGDPVNSIDPSGDGLWDRIVLTAIVISEITIPKYGDKMYMIAVIVCRELAPAQVYLRYLANGWITTGSGFDGAVTAALDACLELAPLDHWKIFAPPFFASARSWQRTGAYRC